MTSPTAIVAYLALFTGVGIGFLFANLLVGKFLRPKSPNVEKLEIYECGEPTIGSSFVQFDLRFYVVALLFIIFDVEIAFFFPWAVVFGKATHLMDPALVTVEASQSSVGTVTGEEVLTPAARGLFRELGVTNPDKSVPLLRGQLEQNKQNIQGMARSLAMISMADIAAFFGVLLAGFAYVWKRGDLDWVRAVSEERAAPSVRGPTAIEEPVLLA